MGTRDTLRGYHVSLSTTASHHALRHVAKQRVFELIRLTLSKYTVATKGPTIPTPRNPALQAVGN